MRLSNPETVAPSATDRAGRYQLGYEYPYGSPCVPPAGSQHILEVSAEGYPTAATAAPVPDGLAGAHRVARRPTDVGSVCLA